MDINFEKGYYSCDFVSNLINEEKHELWFEGCKGLVLDKSFYILGERNIKHKDVYINGDSISIFRKTNDDWNYSYTKKAKYLAIASSYDNIWFLTDDIDTSNAKVVNDSYTSVSIELTDLIKFIKAIRAMQ